MSFFAQKPSRAMSFSPSSAAGPWLQQCPVAAWWGSLGSASLGAGKGSSSCSCSKGAPSILFLETVDVEYCLCWLFVFYKWSKAEESLKQAGAGIVTEWITAAPHFARWTEERKGVFHPVSWSHQREEHTFCIPESGHRVETGLAPSQELTLWYKQKLTDFTELWFIHPEYS